MNATATRTLISADELAAWLARTPQPVVVDTSFDLADTDSGERRYRESHLPGAHYLHLDRDLSGTKTGRNGRHPLPERSAFRRTVGALVNGFPAAFHAWMPPSSTDASAWPSQRSIHHRRAA